MSSSKGSSSDRPGKHPLGVERASARTGRAESKARLDNIERDIAYLRETVDCLLQDLKQTATPPATSSSSTSRSSRRRSKKRKTTANAYHHHSQTHPQHHQFQAHDMTGLLGQDTSLVHRPATTSPSLWWPAKQHMFDPHIPQMASANYDIVTSMANSLQIPTFASHPNADAFVPRPMLDTAPPAPAEQPPLVMDCRCGIQHETSDSCVEVSIYSLFSGSNNVASHVKHPIPRNPEVAELVMQSVSSSNHLSSAIFNIMRHYQSKDLATTAALFFLYYRLFRWRMHPIPEYLDDVPINMRPTASQNVVSHHVSVDLLPWPGLREYLCVDPTDDTRHSVQLYADSTWFAWPEGKDFTFIDSAGNMTLHPEFEERVGDVTSWHLGSPCADIFPHLLQYTV